MESIANSLGIGSGIDTRALIESLTTATRAPREALIKKREDTNTAQISGISQAASGIDAFSTALGTLISGGTLFTQPTVSDSSVFNATAVQGARIGTLATSLEVRQLAQAQSLVSANLTGINSTVGQGLLTISNASGESFNVSINSANDSLVGLARAINAAGAGVTAAIVEDAGGARLTLKSGTGAQQAFTIAVDPSADPALARFAYNPATTGGMTRAQEAQNALLKLDGVDVSRSSNTFSDLIDGVTIALKTAKPGTTVAIGASRPTAALKQAVTDFTDAYNELKGILDPLVAAGSGGTGAGPLRGDTGVRELQRQLSRLTSTVLASGGSVSTLAEIGVRTQRDGTLTVDTNRLDAVLGSDPDAVEAMFNPGQNSSSPLIKITSPYGRAKPGTYAVTDIVASVNGSGATGKIAGRDAISAGTRLVSSVTAPSSGLVIEPLGNVSSATVTVDLGIGNALKSIRDSLRAANGPLSSTAKRLQKDTTTIATDRTKLDTRIEAYRKQLVTSYSNMERLIAGSKATQSYLDQQIKLWTNPSN